MKENFQKNKIVPDVIPKAPDEQLKVSYNSGVQASLGNKLTPKQVKDPPQVTWNADPKSFYVLALVDPDAPSRANPKFREWHHWLIGNIPGNDISKGEVLTAYIGSAPPKDSGFHRYVFLVYKQSGKLQFDEPKLPDNSGNGRGKFSIQKFAEKYNLGDPIAANYYEAEWDDYVPVIYKKLK